MGSPSGFLIRNWTLKLSAFGFALLLWVAVRAESPNRQEISGVAVQVMVGDSAWALVSEPIPPSVTVRFGGPSRQLISMAFDRPTVLIPLEEVAQGDTVVQLSTAWVQIGDRQGVVAEDIQPSSVRLTLEPVERRTLAPTLDLRGELPGRLALSAPPIVEPDVVGVIGPRSRVAALTSVPLAPLYLSGISEAGSVQVPVDSSAVRGLQVLPWEVRVRLELAERVDSEVSGVPVLLPSALQSSTWLQVQQTTGTVVLRGARPLLEGSDALSGLALVVQIDSDEIPPAGTEGEFPLSLTGVPPLLTGAPRQGMAVVRNGGEPPR